MRALGFLAVLGLLAVGGVAEAGPKGKGKRKKREPVEVPIDVGVGPAGFLVSGPVRQDRPLHTGIALSIEAILDRRTLKRLRHRIPAQYRKQVLAMDELRISHMLIPRTIFVSPPVGDATTGMYGILFRPIGLGAPLLRDPVRLYVGVGLIATYAYLPSTTLAGPTHFLRPGIDPGVELEVPITERFLVSVGWRSQLYPPQPVGGSILEVGPLDESIWHIGQAFAKVHVRVPYRVK